MNGLASGERELKIGQNRQVRGEVRELRRRRRESDTSNEQLIGKLNRDLGIRKMSLIRPLGGC
jgi:hypothetical protein